MPVLGIVKETKNPPDTRVPFTPEQCQAIQQKYPQLRILVQPSAHRCFSDNEYTALGISLSEDLSECDVLLGIKEVKPQYLIPGKAYFFFSHTKKKQDYNQDLMHALIEKKIRMIDYECLTHTDDQRVLGFGYYAGLVGAHNAIRTYGKKFKHFDLPAAHELNSLEKMIRLYDNLRLPPLKIAITGSGKVAAGLLEVMNHLDVDAIEPQDYIDKEYQYPVYTHLKGASLYRRKNNETYHREDFHQNPQDYECIFHKYISDTDILMNGIYWDKNIDRLFSIGDINQVHFKISVIADVSCDIDGSVPINFQSTTIGNPVYGVNRATAEITEPYLPTDKTIDLMAVDNLPNELPRDASQYFGAAFEKHVLEPLLEGFDNDLILRATICAQGKLLPGFEYLADYAYE